MTNPTSTISINPTQPIITPEIPLDPSNPLIWLLVLATLMTATEKPLNAIANILKAIALFLNTFGKSR